MKKLQTIMVLVLFIIALTVHPLAVGEIAAQDNRAVTDGCHSLDASFALISDNALIENCKAAFVYETGSETILYGQQQDEKLYPSSLVKIMTALIAAEKGDMNAVVTVKQTVLDTVPISALTVNLKDGEVLTLRDLMYCMMVGSGNDAAAVIADHISGSQESFLVLMNNRATELGCTNTQFMNVTGLHHEEQYTTARDTARILSAAMNNETFATVFSAVYYTVPANALSEERHLVTANYMMHKEEDDLYFDSRVVGGRTGVTEIGERNIAVYAQSGDMSVVSIVMGSKSVTAADGYSIGRYGGYLETIDLLDEVFGKYERAQILFENQALKQYSVYGGDSVVVAGPNVNVATVLPQAVTIDQLDFRFVEGSQPTAPVSEGDKLSAVQVWYGGLCVAQADLFALNSVKGEGEVVITSNHPSAGGNGIWLVLLIVMVCVVIGTVVTVRSMNTVRTRKVREKPSRRRRT